MFAINNVLDTGVNTQYYKDIFYPYSNPQFPEIATVKLEEYHSCLSPMHTHLLFRIWSQNAQTVPKFGFHH